MRLFSSFAKNPQWVSQIFQRQFQPKLEKTQAKELHKAQFYLSCFFTLLNISSHTNPLPNKIAAIIAKSNRVQFTSLVYCMATHGISNKMTIGNRMMVNPLFFIVYTNGLQIRGVGDFGAHNCLSSLNMMRSTKFHITSEP